MVPVRIGNETLERIAIGHGVISPAQVAFRQGEIVVVVRDSTDDRNKNVVARTEQQQQQPWYGPRRSQAQVEAMGWAAVSSSSMCFLFCGQAVTGKTFSPCPTKRCASRRTLCTLLYLLCALFTGTEPPTLPNKYSERTAIRNKYGT
jgi:hypothetical protein